MLDLNYVPFDGTLVSVLDYLYIYIFIFLWPGCTSQKICTYFIVSYKKYGFNLFNIWKLFYDLVSTKASHKIKLYEYSEYLLVSRWISQLLLPMEMIEIWFIDLAACLLIFLKLQNIDTRGLLQFKGYILCCVLNKGYKT